MYHIKGNNIVVINIMKRLHIAIHSSHNLIK